MRLVLAALVAGLGSGCKKPRPYDPAHVDGSPVTAERADVGSSDVAGDTARAPGSDAPEMTAADTAVDGSLADTGAVRSQDPAMPPPPCGQLPPPAHHAQPCGCDGSGQVGCSGACSKDETSCVPAGQWFWLSNMALGDDKVMDTWGGDGPNAAFMNMPCCSGSSWRITALGGGDVRLTNMFLEEPRALESHPDGGLLVMGNNDGRPSQTWKIVGAAPGLFRIHNKLFGVGRSLDVKKDVNNDPFMAPTTSSASQLWKMRKQP